MPRLSPEAAAQYRHIHPVRAKTFSRPLRGAASLSAWTDFVAECYGNGVPGDAVLGVEGQHLMARWTVPVEDFPRNR